MKKIKKDKLPGYIYLIFLATILVAGFAMLVGSGVISLGQHGLIVK